MAMDEVKHEELFERLEKKKQGVWVVKNKMTGERLIMKEITLEPGCDCQNHNEVRAMRALKSESFPRLVDIQRHQSLGNTFCLCMTYFDSGVTVQEIIDHHVWRLAKNTPKLRRLFSICMFHGLLSMVKEMHCKNWSHGDLHGGNLIVMIDTMELKVIDFGHAQPLHTTELGAVDDYALKIDILNVIRLFCGLYVWQTFKSHGDLQKKIESADGTLEEALKEAYEGKPMPMENEEKEELLDLIQMTSSVTSTEDIHAVLRHIEDILKLKPDEMQDELKKAAPILFPDWYGRKMDSQSTSTERSRGSGEGSSGRCRQRM